FSRDWSSDVCSSDLLGLDEADAALWLVEWPDRGVGALPPADLHLRLEIEGAGRGARLEAGTPAGRDWLQCLGQAGHLRPTAEPRSEERRGGKEGRRP